MGEWVYISKKTVTDMCNWINKYVTAQTILKCIIKHLQESNGYNDADLKKFVDSALYECGFDYDDLMEILE